MGGAWIRPGILLGGRLVAAGIAMVGSSALAIGIYVPDQDAEATARADAFIAKADNPSAVYYNPAGLTQPNGWSFSGTLYGIQMRPQYRGLASVDSREGIQILPQFYAAYHPTNGALAFGLGVSTPFGLGVDYGKDSALRQIVTEDSLQFLNFNAMLAWQVTPSFALAAGPAMNFAEISLGQGLSAANVGDAARFEGRGNSLGATVGMRWQIRRFSLGAVYRSSMPIDYSGTFELQPGTLPMPVINEPAHMKLHIPTQVGIGVGCDVTEGLQVEIDALWTEWSSWDDSVLKKPSGNLSSQYMWRDSWILSAGMTCKVAKGTDVHAGYGYAQETVPDATFTPAIPDSARHVFGVGVSQRVGRRLRCTLVFQEVVGEDRNIANSVTLPGTYSFGATALSTSFVFTF